MMEDSSKSNMMWLDYIIFISILVLSLAIGVYHACTGGKQKTINEYLVANRRLGVIPTMMSLYISGISSIYILGLVAEMYLFGSQMWMAVVGNSCALLVSCAVFLPVVYPMKLVSSLEYYKKRYRSNIFGKIGVVQQLFSGTMSFGLQLYATSTALEAVSGIPMWISIVSTALLAIVYTSLGGMLAVIWTDLMQGSMVLVGMVVILILAIVKVGGFAEIWNLCDEGGRLIFFNTNPDPTERQTLWTALFGSFFGILFVVIANQAFIQRLCAVQSFNKARITICLLVVPYWFLHAVVCLLGLTVYAYYRKMGCDPLRSGLINNANQLLPYFIVDALGYPGLTGLIIAILFCASLSTLSTSLNGISAILWKEFLEGPFRKMREVYKAAFAKTIVVIFGGVGIGMAFLLPYLPGHVQQVYAGVLGGIGSPMAGLLALGVLFRCANKKGALCGLSLSFAFTAWVVIGQNVSKPHREFLITMTENCSANTSIRSMPTNPEGVLWPYKVSYQYLSVIGMFSCVILGLIFSLIFGGEDPELDDMTCLKWPCLDPENRSRRSLKLNTNDEKDEIKGIEVLSIMELSTNMKFGQNVTENGISKLGMDNKTYIKET